MELHKIARGGILFLCVVLSISFLPSCEEDSYQTPEDLEFKSAIHQVMKDWYLWNHELPVFFHPDNYQSGEEVMKDLAVGKYDRWSRVGFKQDYTDKYTHNTTIGPGFVLKYAGNGDWRIAYIYEASVAHREGLRRGTKIVAVNGIDAEHYLEWGPSYNGVQEGIRNDITYVDEKDSIKTIAITNEKIKFNTVLHRSVIHDNEKAIGYLVFKSFVDTAMFELEEAFDLFDRAHIDELIVDLRYNGGGRLSVAKGLASHIVPFSGIPREFCYLKNNESRKEDNKYYYFDTKNRLNLKRVVFLVSHGTASASELVINSLKPYMEVILIGTTTYGKPVGSKTFFHHERSISPICFQVYNAKMGGDYFQGMEPDYYCFDFPLKDFGHPEESMLFEALHFLRHGNVSGQPQKKSSQDFLEDERFPEFYGELINDLQ